MSIKNWKVCGADKGGETEIGKIGGKRETIGAKEGVLEIEIGIDANV